MSNKMERIVGKAVLDAAFRDALIADPEVALAAAEINLGNIPYTAVAFPCC